MNFKELPLLTEDIFNSLVERFGSMEKISEYKINRTPGIVMLTAKIEFYGAEVFVNLQKQVDYNYSTIWFSDKIDQGSATRYLTLVDSRASRIKNQKIVPSIPKGLEKNSISKMLKVSVSTLIRSHQKVKESYKAPLRPFKIVALQQKTA